MTMRCLAFLLSFMLLTVSLQPAFEAWSEESQTECCSSEGCGKNADSKKQEENTAEKICNPLMGCCACVGFTPTNIMFSMNSNFEESATLIGYDFSDIAAPTLDVWQPPKVS